MSGFMFFSKLEREFHSTMSNSSSELYYICLLTKLYIVSPVECSVEEKEPYEAKAREDKKRYKDEISDYKNPQPMNVDSANVSDGT
ncbi:hypothetical protein ACSQ67_024301 [Phaseolus vulgaris]